MVFEKVGTAYTYGDTWTIISKLRLPNFTKIFQFIELSEESISVLCEKLLNRDHDGICIHWNEEISRKLGLIRLKIEEIRLATTSRHRTRRGLLNLGGRLSKFLFGTMDDEDASRIYEKLEDLEKGNHHHLNMAKQQITLLKTTTDLMGSALTNLTENQNYLVNKINRFNEQFIEIVKNQGAEVKQATFKSELNELVLFIINQVMTIETSLTDTLLIIDSLKHRELSPLMIPPKQFEALYANITLDHYKEPYRMDIPLITRLAKVHYEVESGEIYLRIVIPLLDNHVYSLNKLYIIPVPSEDGGYYMLDLDVSYFLNCTQVHRNIELRENEYKRNCALVDMNVVVCKNRNIIPMTPGKNTCASQMFRAAGAVEGNTMCNHRVVRSVQDTLIPMERSNAWLFWLKHTNYLTCQCPDQEYVFKLDQVGILETLRDCRYHIGGYLIPYQKETVMELEFFQPKNLPLPSINISKYREILGTEEGISLEPLQMMDARKWREELTMHSQSVKSLEGELTHWEAKTELKNVSLRTNIFMLAATILVIAYLLWKIVYFCRHRKPKENSNNTINSPINISLPLPNPVISRPTQRPPPVPIGHTSREGEYVVPNPNTRDVT